MVSPSPSPLAEMALVAFEEIPDAIVLSRLDDGLVIAVNQVFLDGTGLRREAVIGHTTVELGLWRSEEERRSLVSRLGREGALRDLERQPTFQAPDGRVVYLSQTLRRVEIQGVPHVLSISRDVTAQRLLEQRLQEERDRLAQSEARFRALIEKSTDMVFVFDARWRFQFWSPSATESLGWSADEVLGKDPLELGLVHPEDVGIAEVRRASAASLPRTPVHGLMRIRSKAGRWHLLESVARNLLDDPAVAGIVLNARDVTERQALAAQVERAQKLETVGRLAGGVAHDFNNLLTAILSCAEVLRESAGDRDQEWLADVEQILAAGWRARDLTRQLLAFARQQRIAPVLLDLNEVLRGCEGLYRRVSGEAVRVETELAPGLWPVLCDPGQLEQVLMNLVVNARDAMPAGGRLSFSTANAARATPRGGTGEQDLVRLVVRDTGVGMSAEARAHLFEPFFSTKPPGKGTGLGLATVYGIVRQSGGDVEVESEPGRGTAVTVTFPRAFAPEAAPPGEAPAHAAPSPRRGGETLLVVEDDAVVRRVMVRALADAGYRVLVAADGEEAQAIARREAAAIDLVVTDVVMPGPSGAALVEALRSRWPALRALLLSGYSGDAIAERGVLDGRYEFLAKPFTPTTLLDRVRGVLERA